MLEGRLVLFVVVTLAAFATISGNFYDQGGKTV